MSRFGTPESDGSLGIIPKGSDYWGMPYAIFSDDEQISKAFSTEADVWKHARENGLVVEIHDHDDKEAEEYLDNEYRVLSARTAR